jgi:hypothetical protein
MRANACEPRRAAADGGGFACSMNLERGQWVGLETLIYDGSRERVLNRKD